MATKADDALTMAGAALASAAPKEWDQFGIALTMHVDQVMRELVASDNMSLYQNQGRAKHAQWVLDHLAKAKADAQKIHQSAQKG